MVEPKKLTVRRGCGIGWNTMAPARLHRNHFLCGLTRICMKSTLGRGWNSFRRSLAGR